MKKILVTGGAGFVGNHLVNTLMMQKFDVHVVDNLSSGRLENIKQWFGNPNFTFIRREMLDSTSLQKFLKDCSIVFHLATNPEVRVSSVYPDIQYQQNVAVTFMLLEAIRKAGSVETFVFTSSSTIYGEATKIPTPENYGPLEPISIYGATKLACEALITAYAHTYGFKAIVYRLANIIGPRSQHGVIRDFIAKLQKKPEELEILGDGTQTKSYLYITDCIEAISLGLEKAHNNIEVFNVGSEDQINVKTIAQIVIEEMRLKDVKIKFTGGVDGGRGWKGDVKNMLLDITKLKSLGWKSKLNSKEAVRQATRDLIKEIESNC